MTEGQEIVILRSLLDNVLSFDFYRQSVRNLKDQILAGIKIIDEKKLERPSPPYNFRDHGEDDDGVGG